jgi:hypothetical protein
VEQFKNGSFITPASTSTQPNFSPGACQPPSTFAGTVKNGVTGSLHGYFIIPLPTGIKQTSTSPSLQPVGRMYDRRLHRLTFHALLPSDLLGIYVLLPLQRR